MRRPSNYRNVNHEKDGKDGKDGPKSPYRVTLTIDGDSNEFITRAYSESSAISNAAFRLSKETGDSVGLIMWKIKEDRIECNVEEMEEGADRDNTW
jgi:hypothetical protein